MSAVAPLLKPLGLHAPTKPAGKTAAKSRPRLRLVAPPRSSAGRVPFAILIGAVMVGGLVTLLMLHTIAAQDGFKVNALQAQQKTLNDQLQSLEQTVQSDSSPATLRQRAADLGMVPSVVNSYTRLKDGRARGLETPVIPVAPVVTTPTATTTTKTGSTAKTGATATTGKTGTATTGTSTTTKHHHGHAGTTTPGTTTTGTTSTGTTSTGTTTGTTTDQQPTSQHAGHPHR